jgi:hypothetical protein
MIDERKVDKNNDEPIKVEESEAQEGASDKADDNGWTHISNALRYYRLNDLPFFNQ